LLKLKSLTQKERLRVGNKSQSKFFKCPIPKCGNIFKKEYGLHLVNPHDETQQAWMCPPCGYAWKETQITDLNEKIVELNKQLHKFKSPVPNPLIKGSGGIIT